MERLYQHRPWMQEGMYVVGIRPHQLGEGVVVQAYSGDYQMVWQYWLDRNQLNLGIYQWKRGILVCVGVKKRLKNGVTVWVPVPPRHLATA